MWQEDIMSRYHLKVLVATLLIAAIAIIVRWFTDTDGALLVGACGVIVVTNRHICRCRFCGSWRTYITEQWVPDRRSEYGTVYESRFCSKCGLENPVDEYRAAMWEHKSFLGGG
jgi:hypothetical protein